MNLLFRGPVSWRIASFARIAWGASLLALLVACSKEDDPHSRSEEDSTNEPSGTGGTSDPSGSGGEGVEIVPARHAGDVTLRDGTVDFVHADFTLNDNYSVASQNNNELVTTTYPVKIIENDLVRVTLLPEYGGRILSIIYKPTNHELLYQNSVGTPFGAGAGNFYYDWLMVYGGIFPTFPESEHGKTWFLPWETKIVQNNADEVAIEMSFTDDISPEDGVPPERFSYGRTDLSLTATVSVRRGRSSVGLSLELLNNRASEVPYEYWTCTTLTPGSTPGETYSPQNTEMIVPLERVYSSYGWVDGVEESVGDDVFVLDKLRSFSEWNEPGILYAEPRMLEDYWGVINHENEVGIFRVADADSTPGLKFWTWGRGSTESDLSQPDDRRPYIELWAGHSTRFFQPTTIAGNETKSWTETYLPTIGLSEVTYVNEFGAVHLSEQSEGGGLRLTARVFTTLPSIPIEVVFLEGLGSNNELSRQTWTPDESDASELSVLLGQGELPAGASWALLLETKDGQELLRTAISRE